jgi:hypothetical protein
MSRKRKRNWLSKEGGLFEKTGHVAIQEALYFWLSKR